MPTAPTAAPTLRISLGIVGGTPVDTDPVITLTWNVVPPAKNGGEGIDGYEIEYKTSDDDDTEWTTWVGGGAGFVGPTAAANLQSYSALHGSDQLLLAPGTTYEYRVRAFNDADGNGTGGGSPDDSTPPDATQVEENGPWSNVASMKTKAVAPSTPTLNPVAGDAAATTHPLAAWTLNTNSITVRWTEPATGGSPITSYQLRVSTNDNGDIRFGETDTEDAVISNLPGNRTEYTHTGLKTETTYYYSIRALNDADGDRRPGEAVEGSQTTNEISEWSPVPVGGAS